MGEQKKNGWKMASWALLVTGVIVFAIINILVVFFCYSRHIHRKILDQNMEQIGNVSDYVVRIIRNEMKHCIETLEVSEEIFSRQRELISPESVDQLIQIRDKTGFTIAGLMDRDGNAIDDTGTGWQVDQTGFLKVMDRGEVFISDVFNSERQHMDQILVMVPLETAGQIQGAVWGQYPISFITDIIDQEMDFDLYFQIVDDKGRYISRSQNENALATERDMLLWEEMERYEYLEGDTVEKVKEKVENYQSGMLYFQYGGQGRYVSYQPLGINNWYVFSAMPSDQLNGYVNEIQGLSLDMLLWFSLSVALVVGVVILLAYEGNRRISQKNRELAIKNQLFRIVMDKTQDTPFELDLAAGRVKIYRSRCQDDAEYDVLENITPEAMTDRGYIQKKDRGVYEHFYRKVICGLEVEPLVLQLKADGAWEWNRIHVLTVDETSAVGFLEGYTEQMDQKHKLETISRKTRTDALTGLYNRETFVEAVEERLKTIQDLETAGLDALFILDLDHFKTLNDTLGHMMGDQALKQAGANLRFSIRKTDLAGRLGGDEFVLFLEELPDLFALEQCAKKVNKALLMSWEREQKRVDISASVGIAIAERGMAFKELYEKADQALYEVKRHGRNGYRIAEQGKP